MSLGKKMPSLFEALDPPGEHLNMALLQSGAVEITVVVECGGTADTHVVSKNDPLRCKASFCGQYCVRRGAKVAYGRTPLIALHNLGL